MPESVVGDSGRLRQVLVNLTGNAIKFTERGEVVVRVSRVPVPVPDSGAKEGEGGGERERVGALWLHFSVRDTGIGIPPEKQAVIFNAFEQADNSITREFGGTGLGLAISKQLVEMMGGRLEVKSEPGRGSCFSFTARFKPSCGPEVMPQVEPSLPEPPVRTRPLRVLLAEDSIANQKLAVRVLEKMGHTVTVVENGLQAVQALEREVFDLVLMDVQMPVMGGFEATEQIRQKEKGAGRHTPIIALTAHAMTGDRERCLQAGADDYVSKPIRTPDLACAIARVAGATPAEGGRESDQRQAQD